LAYQGFSFSKGTVVKRPKTEWLDYIKYDTESCLSWFEKHLGYQPSAYCFPFNEYTPMLVEILKSYGFNCFYNGKSGDNNHVFTRMDIDTLVNRLR